MALATNISTQTPVPESGRGRRLLGKLGPFIVLCAILSALASFFVLAGLTPIPPTNDVVLSLFAADVVVVLALVGLVVAEAWALIRAWRKQAAASRLHIRIVGLFSIIAAAARATHHMPRRRLVSSGLQDHSPAVWPLTCW